MSSSEKLVEVYRANGEMEAQVIRSLLEYHGIPCLLKGDAARNIYGLTVDGLAEVRIMVWERMADRARSLIKGREV
ncbi:MAG TPA: DUF2007 domain-containing protein [Dehalococcoidia bacterium]|nr:DUF2007 domain-containing protein [Dehalococcoidia bacterium]